MAIMFVRAQVISRGAGRSVVSAAAYRHRTKMEEEQTGLTFRYEGGKAELVHEELAMPDDTPAWLRIMIDGETVARASEVLWNAVDTFENRADAQLARELIFALPEELSKAENIALVREFVQVNLTSKGMVADWVYHDKDGNPHIHLMTTLRPLTVDGFGAKKVPVLGDDGEPLRVVTPDRPKGKIVYQVWAGDKETMKAWKIAWAETTTKHLALAGHDIRLDGRSYAEQGLDGIAQQHMGPAKAALARKGQEMYFAPAALARRQEMADRLADEPGLLLKQLSNERSTFDEREIAKALHRYVDDPTVFANVRAQLMASPHLVTLKPQQIDPDTGKAREAAVFTTRSMLRTEYDMAQSASALSRRSGFKVTCAKVDDAISVVESRDPAKTFKLDVEQVDAVRHATGDSGIAAVVGLAGAGKSTLLDAARIAWEADGRRVIGAALAGKAAEGLEDSSGIRSRTIASWELAWADGKDQLQKGDVLVVDEAGMVSSEQLARVLKAVESAEAKVVLVGDPMQLQPIQAGAAFRAIVERIGFAELIGIRRQKEQWACDASRLFARGKVEEALDAYARHDRIIEVETRDAAIARIVTDWGQAREDYRAKAERENRILSGSELLVLAQTNDDVRKLNVGIRTVMAGQGALNDERTFQTERGVREFAVGDRLIFLENARFFEGRAEHLAVQHVKNGMLGTVIRTTSERGDTLLTVRLDAGREVTFGQDTYRNVDHGYAATVHKSQGATVDRTLVLATGLMDQHLAYVAMSRHRDRADLYMARQDFAPRQQWDERSRVDHAAGVTGELVELGQTHYRSDTDSDPSPFADVRTDDDRVYRVWGVSLPKAIEDAGVVIGDTVTLRKDGVEKVNVRIPLVDPETGRKKYEEREVERNVWTAKQIETADARQVRIEQESHRPELFKQLVERLSRSGAKTTTLDYESEAAYQAQIVDFARRRGMVHAADIAAGMEEGAGRRLSWIAAQRDRGADLWQSASVALGFEIECERSVSYDADAVARTNISVQAARVPEKSRYLLPPQEHFVRSLEAAARTEHLTSARWKEREAILLPVLERVYRDPAAALARLNARASAWELDPRRLGEDLVRDPSLLGVMRGSASLFEKQAARKERAAAVAAVVELAPLARSHAERFSRDQNLFENREYARRAAMSLSVPAMSPHAVERLREIEAVREKGGEDAYKTAFAYVSEERSLVQEMKAVGEALTARFGWSAFTDKADQYAQKHMVDRMPESMPREEQDKLAALFTAVRRFNELQYLAEKRDPSRIVAPAAYDPARAPDMSAPPALPMLAAVTEFKSSVDDEARRRAAEGALYKQQRAALGDVAQRIWQDPSATLATIEDLVTNGIDPDRIARAVANQPSAYGALRGTDRIMDRLLASGKERKEAEQGLETAVARVRSMGQAWRSAFDAEKAAVEADRNRMNVPVPGLSRSAEAELVRLSAAVEKSPKDITLLIRSIDAAVKAEFAAVSKALDARFGPSAIARGDQAVTNRVPSAQRKIFEALQPRLKILQQAVLADRAQDIISERQMRSLGQARGMNR
ncbi:Ti-type conjugative transfer relaxase TraA [Ochrobactrum sp. 695/2009]|nr:Ti-type conjugative transfer relaxase TraA [Brucella intermedia]PJR92440.1 Ti-type conjugative transfer relaxase TraA [Ochrobactrum sp. 721/2009]PJT15736.1 Ti-type conjugative transfer relaxase TraA [Ochrobactrum sp. 720/2009]PJT23902.1 Ti-type conjugative transfer relaxase TraA [Ochrobactrum sp. 715/2009]PJT24046.1 Ti-type conjugative transfer relaxase TraA [Ochrobactrum sp. 695/2009]PJT33577.1 Ti-type conjugative transfer relaxase TraA [Ochrobactrum sp. 689/2009]